MIENKPYREEDVSRFCPRHDSREIAPVIRRLDEIAKALRRERFENGALQLEKTKLQFILDPLNGQPTYVILEETNDAHRYLFSYSFVVKQDVKICLKLRLFNVTSRVPTHHVGIIFINQVK